MNLSSPKLVFDKKLLTIEELFRQRKYSNADEELSNINIDDYLSNRHELGLYYSLNADNEFYKSNYKKAIENGLKGAKLLADFALHKRYGKVQQILSKSYNSIGDFKNAEIRARDAISAYRRCNDSEGQAVALNNLAYTSLIRCNFKAVVEYLEEAILLVNNDQKKVMQFTGNLATVRILLGDWKRAEEDIQENIKYNKSKEQDFSVALHTLVLGFLQIRQRKFHLASKSLDNALEIISRLDMVREKVIYLEYAGELHYEKGDMYKAKSILSKAYEKGLMIAPGSALVSQVVRRLAEVELALDNIDEAMKYAQKGLEISLAISERIEIALSKKVIADVYTLKEEYDEAIEYITQAVDIAREVGDPFELARTLLKSAEIKIKAKTDNEAEIRQIFEEAEKLFKKLNLDYWIAETEFRAGMYACQIGELSEGFKALSKAETVFAEQNDKVKTRAVSKFLKSLSENAVALSVSQNNEFKIFGNLITPSEISNIRSSNLEQIFTVLINRTNADRALVYTSDNEEPLIHSSFPISTHQSKKFAKSFTQLLGEEISKSKPSILLDCRRDPFINGLFAESSDIVASMIVVPFKMSDNTVSYLYLDKLSRDNSLNPFSQSDLNFAVGFSDIISFKWAEIQKQKLAEDNLRLRDQLREKAAFPNIVTKNIQMLELLAQVRQVVDSNISVSIEGETGSGKDVLARAIHYNSNRRDKRFISVNCAALPETLLESELFGYKRGAFTGANTDKRGLFEEADGGTFFLDEIGDMPLSIQAKVLRILEEKEIVRLGETVSRKVDVRIISATNKDLKELMSAKQFRQDLYYRLSALTFHIPALRERKDDIPLLISHFLKDSDKKFTAEALKLMISYDWQGNVRELENEVRKLELLAGDNEFISQELVSSKISQSNNTTPAAAETMALVNSDDVSFSEEFGLYDYLEQHEKKFIEKALGEKRGVKKHAADMLNIPESTLRLKIKQYNIDLKQFKKK